MTNRKLGEMSGLDLDEHECKTVPCSECEENNERSLAAWYGKPGKHAALSRELVKEFLGPLLVEPRAPEGWSDPDTGWNDAIHACARALLALPPDAPSPLEESDR